MKDAKDHAASHEARQNGAPTSNTTQGQKTCGHPRGPDGKFTGTHRAYARLNDKELRATRHRRFRYALALGFPSWSSTPAPVQAKILSAVRLEFYEQHLFSPFWEGGEVPRRFEGVREALRWALRDLGLARPPETPSLEAIRQRYEGQPR